jgi:hypothetical protein
MESFFSLLQKDVLDRRSWATREELRIAVVTWIERTYHRRRRQASLGRLTSVVFKSVMTTPVPGRVTGPVTQSCTRPVQDAVVCCGIRLDWEKCRSGRREKPWLWLAPSRSRARQSGPSGWGSMSLGPLCGRRWRASRRGTPARTAGVLEGLNLSRTLSRTRCALRRCVRRCPTFLSCTT